MDALLLAVSIVGGLSLPSIAASLIVFSVGQRQRRRDAVAERQRQLVQRVLETVDRVLVRQTSLKRYVAHPLAADFGGLYGHVLLDVGRGNEAIAGWVLRQVQHMLATASPTEPLRIAGTIAGQLMAWQRGDTKVAWFERELDVDPIEKAFRVPLSTRVARSWEQMQVGFVVGGIVLGVSGLAQRAFGARPRELVD